jgi:hypothetical protein
VHKGILVESSFLMAWHLALGFVLYGRCLAECWCVGYWFFFFFLVLLIIFFFDKKKIVLCLCSSSAMAGRCVRLCVDLFARPPCVVFAISAQLKTRVGSLSLFAVPCGLGFE